MTCSKSSELGAENQGLEPTEFPQPPGYSRNDAESRLAEKLKRFGRLPDEAMVTVFLGDLRKLNDYAR